MKDYDRGYDQGRADCIELATRHLAEIERLRAALEYYASGIVGRGDIARAALGADEQTTVKER